MKKSMKIVLSIVILLGIYFSAMGSATASDVSIDPTDPVVGSSVTFTAEIYDANAVYIIVKECTSEFCFPPQNVSMPKIDDDTYEMPVLLQHDDAVYIEYQLVVESDMGWETSEWTKVYLLEKPDNGETNDASNGDDDDGTPGFGVISVMMSIIIGMLLFQRKRLR